MLLTDFQFSMMDLMLQELLLNICLTVEKPMLWQRGKHEVLWMPKTISAFNSTGYSLFRKGIPSWKIAYLMSELIKDDPKVSKLF